MKSRKESKQTKNVEVTESFDSSNLDPAQKQEILKSFKEYRQTVELKRTAEDKLRIQLLQLKYLMEDYVDKGTPNGIYNFGFFLKEYINRLDRKNKEFAEDVDIEPIKLSQIINRHRNPSEEFIIRLEIHSNKNFPAIIWQKVLEKEKEYNLINNTEIRIRERKHVKNKLAFSF